MFDSVQVPADSPTQNISELGMSIFEPPRGPVLAAISRNKRTVLIVAVVFAILGVAAGVVRKPTYSATTTLQVGTVNLNAPSFSGSVQGDASVATVFSRAIFASSVLDELHSKLGVSPGEAAERLSAEPIPLSPSFNIVATGATAKDAMTLANTVSRAVIAYERKAASATSPQASALLSEYDAAAQALQKAHALVQYYSTQESLQRAGAAKGGHSQSSLPSKASIQARVTEDEARTRAEAIGASYRSVTTNAAGANPSSGLISIVAEATTTTNNRKSKVELDGLVGLFAGVIIGCALAVLRERRRTERMISAEMEAGVHGSQSAA
jgi:capsular polysaccharide biosynthesis protein